MKLMPILMRVAMAIMLPISQPLWSAPHLDIDVSVDPKTRMLNASALISADVDTLTFYLAEGFVLEAAELDGATVPAALVSVEGLQRFEIELHAEQGTRTVSLRYHGELQPLDSAMTHDDTLAVLPAMTSEQGSYLPGASGWHPMFESAFTYRLTVSVPDGQIAVAPGTASNESTSNGIRRANFSLAHPIEGIDLMVGPWKISERDVRIGGASIRLRTYFYSDSDTFAGAYLDAAHRFIERYSGEIGPYPFAEFSVVASPIPTGFGMPTLTYLGKDVLGFPFIREISLGHEVLHNWWGNGVRIDPVRGNWAEGLTTFMADYAYREDDSPQAAMRMRHGWLRDYAALPAGSEQPLSAFRARHRAASAAIGYGKAAMMFYALRAKLGAETFQQGIRIFWKQYKFTPASFNNLRDSFAQAAGQPLDGFFDQWLERTGAPLLKVASAQMAGKGTASKLKIEIAQDAEPLQALLPLRLFTDNTTMVERVNLSQPMQAFELATGKAVKAIQIDPRFEVWRKLAPPEAPPILRDLIAAESILVTAVDRRLDDSVLNLAREFSEGNAKQIKPDSDFDPGVPLLVVGSKSACVAFLKRLSLGARAADVPAGSVEVWIDPDLTRRVIVVALEPDVGKKLDLSKLGRRLRHFGRYSWVSFAEDGAAERGNWTVKSPRVSVPK